jgi:hypothetical protein
VKKKKNKLAEAIAAKEVITYFWVEISDLLLPKKRWEDGRG